MTDRYQLEADLIEWEKDLAESEEELRKLSDGDYNTDKDLYELDCEFLEAEIAKARRNIARLSARLEPEPTPPANA